MDVRTACAARAVADRHLSADSQHPLTHAGEPHTTLRFTHSAIARNRKPASIVVHGQMQIRITHVETHRDALRIGMTRDVGQRFLQRAKEREVGVGTECR